MIVVEDYTFTPGARGAGTIAIPQVLELEDIQRIWNVTRGALVYEATNPQFGIVNVAVANGVTTLTIETDTTTMQAGDLLQILLYDGAGGGNGGGGGIGGADGEIDAFGRIRVSQGLTLADYKNIYDIDPEILEDTNSGGTIAHVANESAILLTNDVNVGDYIAAQTRMYHQYQPGKSQLVLASFNFLGEEEFTFKRVGLYDSGDGVFLQLDGDGVLSFVRRSSVTGTPTDSTPVVQSAWNVDPCDGTGPSGFDINITKSQLLFIDFQWLGVGRIRVGFVHNGAYVVAHEFHHSNLLDTVYWSQPSLPVRAEIVNDPADAPAAAPTMHFMCATVLSEGGYLESGLDLSMASDIRAIGAAGVQLPLIAIRLVDALNGRDNRLTVRLNGLSVISPVSGVKVQVVRCKSESAVTGGAWASLAGHSGVEYNVTATGYTPGADDVIVDTFYVPAGQGQNAPGLANIINPNASRQGYISQNVASDDSMAYLVFATSLGNNATASAALQWREIG